MNTAGRSVLFAGLTVVISLLGMLLIGLSFVSGLATAAAITVALTMAASLTLLPALLAILGHRLERTGWGALGGAALIAVGLLGVGAGVRELALAAFPAALLLLVVSRFIPGARSAVAQRAQRPTHEGVPYRWSRVVQAHPWLALAVGSGILLLLAAPTLSLRLGFSDEGNYREGTTTRRAYDLLAGGSGPGVNGPFVVTTVLGSPADLPAVDSLFSALAADPDVAAVVPPFPSNPRDPASSDAFLIRLTPTTAPQDAETNELVERLRREVIPTAVAGSSLAVSVTGTVALQIDFATYLATRIPIFFGAVLALSFVLLMVVFRSLLVPLKAVLMNGISLAAAYGVVVAIFQWGWLGSLFGIAGAPIEPQIPMMMFAIVFGLSMDYEVFLLSRVKEAYDQSGDAVESVADGLASTAQVITAAAAIMVVVFGSFAFEDNRVVKLFGVGLAAAVLLDATVVRLLLVPAAMELLGARNWWLPRWLDARLPVFALEAATADGGQGSTTPGPS